MSNQLPEPAWRRWHDESEPISIGISSCLLGQKVRYDGGHKRDRYLNGVLGQWMTWVPYLEGQLYLEPHPRELMLRIRV